MIMIGTESLQGYGTRIRDLLPEGQRLLYDTNILSHIGVSADHSGRPRSLRHELFSPARTLGSWVRIPLKAWTICVCLFSVRVVLCVGSGLATD
jgi:hypothetical protein